MPRLRRNEWNFAHNAAELISGAISDLPDGSPLGHAEPELTEPGSTRRLDLVLFSRENRTLPLITGELKLPWALEGRTPFNSRLVDDAHRKASRIGAMYFLTWNVRRVVVWKTDDPGIELQNRVVFDREIISQPLLGETDLDRPEVRNALRTGVTELVTFLNSLLLGQAQPTFLPLDRLFIGRLEAALDFPIDATIATIKERMNVRRPFRQSIERWMREVQGWVISKANEADNIERASRLSCYVLVNRLCFYNALRRKYHGLPRLSVANNIATGEALQRRLRRAFDDAKRFTRDYETVFDEDFGDDLPFLSDEAVVGWKALIRSLDRYDFTSISLDVIGAMYEQLIGPGERHRYGQHYTQPSVVDLINAFAITAGTDVVLDPACGGGTFLVRAYMRKQYLDTTLDHTQLLETVFGADILKYACHLSTINLAIRDLIDDDNFPRIHLGDFLRLVPGGLFFDQPTRIQSGGLITGRTPVYAPAESFDAIVGNPPYIAARLLPAEDKQEYHDDADSQWPGTGWSVNSDIYCYFWSHAARFLKKGGTLALLTQAGWLDVEYGIPAQLWMLSNFRIRAVLETEAEPWFSDARVATAVTILQSDSDEESREGNIVRFVQFRKPLESVIGRHPSEPDRQRAVERLRDELMGQTADVSTDAYRLRLVRQGDLQAAGRDDHARYTGSKWGRYLRSIETLYQLQKEARVGFVTVSDVASVRRGITTNCDDFFIVADITQEAILRHSAGTFRDTFGALKSRAEAGDLAIVRRSDGFEAALERTYLKPIIKTARDFGWFSTRHLVSDARAVVLPARRQDLTAHARSYIEAGERERWHASPSFEVMSRVGGAWYTLRESEAAPVLFVKTMQYTPIVLLNEGEYFANQRLYEVIADDGVDARALCAVLNSTLVAAERYGAVKALGREAAVDIEVFTARALRVPDLRRASDRVVKELGTLMSQLAAREAGPMLEDALLDTRLTDAQRYAAMTPIDPSVWPSELRDLTRQRIDETVLQIVGVSLTDVAHVRTRIYNELIEHTRKLRLLELQAQINRGGGATDAAPSARHLADEVWAHHVDVPLRHLPVDFVSEAARTVRIPVGSEVQILDPSLFDDDGQYALRIGRQRMAFATRAERDYVAFLANVGVAGAVPLPLHDACDVATREMGVYLGHLTGVLDRAAREITTDQALARRIVREGLKRVLVD